jgi:hypothetical protein
LSFDRVPPKTRFHEVTVPRGRSAVEKQIATVLDGVTDVTPNR